MRDIEKLMANYKPLILATYKKYHPMFNNREDKEDLMAQINTIFAQLVCEYDPRRGVDFPYYIKRMLELRVHHYMTKSMKTKSREVLTKSFTEDQHTFDARDISSEQMEEIIDVLSWDGEFKMGRKQKQLFIGLLQEGKTLHDIAEDEGVDVSVVHTRMHFLIRKIKQQRLEQDNPEQEN